MTSVTTVPGRACRALLRAGIAALLLALSACDEMMPRDPPGNGLPPPPPRSPRPPSSGGFTPDRERVVGFRALFREPHGDDAEVREAEKEAARVSAMHARGGTGAGQLVGTVESGANPNHPDLTGKFPHICAMGDCDDGRPNRPHDPSPRLDDDDHGTQVNGVIAARKNGAGVYGVAYEARIASYANSVSADYPWGNDCDAYSDCPAGVSDKRHQWSELFDREVARGIDWMRSLGVRVTNFSWFRTYEWSREKEDLYRLTADSVRAIMPVTLRALAAYVGGGGVVVWAAGNGDSLHPAVEGMLPRYFPDLEEGWLTVVGFGSDGRIGEFSHYCGDAAEWCIAAPIEVVTTHRDGRWISVGGTSFAAPYVAAGLAALKSMFPHLTQHQIRACMLATADRSPPYDQEWIYGRGRLDLDAASRLCGQASTSFLATERIGHSKRKGGERDQ